MEEIAGVDDGIEGVRDGEAGDFEADEPSVASSGSILITGWISHAVLRHGW